VADEDGVGRVGVQRAVRLVRQVVTRSHWPQASCSGSLNDATRASTSPTEWPDGLLACWEAGAPPVVAENEGIGAAWRPRMNRQLRRSGGERAALAVFVRKPVSPGFRRPQAGSNRRCCAF
jgi:hypothetical protein